MASPGKKSFLLRIDPARPAERHAFAHDIVRERPALAERNITELWGEA